MTNNKNLFNGFLNVDQNAEGRVEITGKAELTPAGKEFVAAAINAGINYIINAASKHKQIETSEEDED